MFGIGASEILVIALVALLILRPRDLPEILRSSALFFAALRRLADDVRFYLIRESYREDRDDIPGSIRPAPRRTPAKPGRSSPRRRPAPRQRGTS